MWHKKGPGRRVLTLVGALSLSALAACGTAKGGSAAGGDGEQVVIRVANFSSESGGLGTGIKAWQEEVREKTDGAVTFENYWSGSLLTTSDMLSGLQGGMAHLGLVIPSYYAQELPVNAWIAGMGAGASLAAERAVGAGGITAYEFLMSDGPARAEYESMGLTPLGATSSEGYTLMCTKPVNGPEDARGLRVRTSGDIWTRTIEALGMTAVDLPFNELYEGLQRGVIDCAVIALSALNSMSLEDVAPHVVPVPFAQLQASTWVWNLETWNSLDPEIQAVMHEATSTMFRATAEWFLNDSFETAKTSLGKDGKATVSDPGALIDVANEQQEEYVRDLPALAPDSVEDPDKVVENYLARLEYWNGVMTELSFGAEPATPEETLNSYLSLDQVDLDPLLERFHTEVVKATAPAS